MRYRPGSLKRWVKTLVVETEIPLRYATSGGVKYQSPSQRSPHQLARFAVIALVGSEGKQQAINGREEASLDVCAKFVSQNNFGNSHKHLLTVGAQPISELFVRLCASQQPWPVRCVPLL